MQRLEDVPSERRELAVHVAILQEQVRALRTSQAELKALTLDQTKTLEAIQKQLTEAKGGLRMMIFLGGAMVTLIAFVGWALQHTITIK